MLHDSKQAPSRGTNPGSVFVVAKRQPMPACSCGRRDVTSWQPDSTPSEGVHLMAGDWMLMGHANIIGVYDHQGGPRGGSQVHCGGHDYGHGTAPAR